MKIEREEFLLHPADDVYPLVRDRIDELLSHLPGIQSVEILSRGPTVKGKMRVRSRWRIRPPALLGRLLPAAAFVWDEDAVSNDRKYCVESTIRGYGYESRAKTFYEPASDWTRVRIEAEISFRRGSADIPKENLERIVSAAQDAVREAIEPNMTALLDAIRERLGSRGTSAQRPSGRRNR